MRYQPIECEVFSQIIAKRDCAWHKKLGWSKTKWHTHNRGQLIYAEFGIMRLFTDNRVYYIPAQHAAWIPEGMQHYLITESPDLVFRTLYLDHQHFDHRFFREISVFYVSRLLREMILHTEQWPMKAPASEEELSFFEAIKHLLPGQATTLIQLQVPVPEDDHLNEITGYLQANLQEKLKAGTVAAKFAMSERNMSRLFVKELRMSFIQYLKLLRIIRAVELLSHESKQVQEVAYEVGYESVPSFTASFKEIMGSAPTVLYKRM